VPFHVYYLGCYTVQRWFLLKGSREPREHIGRAEVTTRSHRPSYFRAPRKRRLFGSSPWTSTEVTRTNTGPDTTPHDVPRSPQTDFSCYEAALGKVEGQIRPQKDESPSCDERCRQEEVVDTDESPMGCEEKGEGIVQGS
jgi:hypothetical protein